MVVLTPVYKLNMQKRYIKYRVGYLYTHTHMHICQSHTITYSHGTKYQFLPFQSYTFNKCKNKSPVKITKQLSCLHTELWYALLVSRCHATPQFLNTWLAQKYPLKRIFISKWLLLGFFFKSQIFLSGWWSRVMWASTNEGLQLIPVSLDTWLVAFGKAAAASQAMSWVDRGAKKKRALAVETEHKGTQWNTFLPLHYLFSPLSSLCSSNPIKPLCFCHSCKHNSIMSSHRSASSIFL